MNNKLMKNRAFQFGLLLLICSLSICTTTFAQSYTYDALGRLKSAANAGRTAAYSYDAVGNITSLTTSASASIHAVEPSRRLADGTVEQRFATSISGGKVFDLKVSGLPEGAKLLGPNAASGNGVRSRLTKVRVTGQRDVTLRFSGVTGELNDFRPNFKLTSTQPPGKDNSAPVIHTMEFTDGRCHKLEFSGIPGKTYAIEHSEDLTHWQRAAEPVKAGKDRSLWQDLSAAKPTPARQPAKPRHYRVVALG